MASLREEIADVTTTLFQIQMERDNLLKALRAQGENFNHFYRIYQDKNEALMKEKKNETNISLQYNARLHEGRERSNASV